MPLTNAAKNSMLNNLGTLITYASLHTADPGTTGANELSGGSPAYARKAISWNAASNGSITSSASVTFDVPGGSTVTHVGFWSAATGGTFYGSADVTDETFASQGTYTITSATISLT